MCEVLVWHGFCDCAFGSAQNDGYPDLRVQVSMSGFSGQQWAQAGIQAAQKRVIPAQAGGAFQQPNGWSSSLVPARSTPARVSRAALSLDTG